MNTYTYVCTYPCVYMYLKCSTYLKGKSDGGKGVCNEFRAHSPLFSPSLFLLAAKIGELFAIELKNVPGEWSCSVKVEAATAAVVKIEVQFISFFTWRDIWKA